MSPKEATDVQTVFSLSSVLVLPMWPFWLLWLLRQAGPVRQES